MNFGKETKITFEVVGEVLRNGKYKLISLISGIFVFALLYYFLVAKVADKSIWISVMMSGAGFITFSVATIIVSAVLTGILVSILVFKFQNYNSLEGKGLFGFVGSGIAAFGIGCPTCGAFLFGLIGAPLALTYFPFRGIEMQIVGVIVLIISIYFTCKSIKGVCNIR